MSRLHYSSVREIAYKVNRMAGLSETGHPLKARSNWICGALTLENGGYGTWSVGKITSTRGGVTDIYRGKLVECKAYLEGMEQALTLMKGN